MPESDTEKRVQTIIDDIDIIAKDVAALKKLKEKLDIIVDDPKKKPEKKSGTWKESSQLFLAVIVGAVGAELLHSFFEPEFINNLIKYPAALGAYVFTTLFAIFIFSVVSIYFPNIVEKFYDWRK